MLGPNDIVTFTLNNIKDNEGVLINKSYELPLSEELILPENVERVSIIEKHTGEVEQEFTAFNIYVGKRSMLKNVQTGDSRAIITCPLNFNSIHDECVYRETKNGIEIFAPVKENDVVVSDFESLVDLLRQISNQVFNIKIACKKVKGLHL